MWRHPALTAAIVAMAVRTVAAVALLVLVGDNITLDDNYYEQYAAVVASGEMVAFGDGAHGDIVRNLTFILPIALVYEGFGVHNIIGPLVAAAFGSAAVAAVAWVALKASGQRAALIAGLGLALTPSVVLWSSIGLKDAASWAMLAGLAVAVAISARDRGKSLAIGAAGTGLFLFGLGHLRFHTMAVAAIAVVLSSWIAAVPHRVWRGLALTAVAVVAPWLAGYGPGGTVAVEAGGSLAERRALNAEDASTAVVEPRSQVLATTTTTRPPLALPEGEVQPAPEAPLSGSIATDLAHLPRGLSVMLLEPYPWQATANVRVMLALAEHVIWYPVLVLAVVGTWQARRRLETLAFPVFAAAGVIAMYALVEGNFGTAFRHRAEATWALWLLAGVGAAHLLAARRAEKGETPA